MNPFPSMFDPGRHEWHEKMLRHFAGALSVEEQRVLNEALKVSEELRRELALLAVQQVHVGQLREEESGKIVALDQVSGPKAHPWYQRWHVTSAAACAMLLAVVLLWPKGSASQPAVRFTSLQGEVWVQQGDTKHRAHLGASLQPGEMVHTSFGAEAVLAFAEEATQIALAEESVLALPVSNTASYVLDAGTMSAVIAPQPRGRPLLFRTPQAEGAILGTTIRVACNASTTHLAVDEGKAQLQRLANGAAVQVGAGQFAAVRENEPLMTRPSPPAGQGTGLLGEYFSWGNFESSGKAFVSLYWQSDNQPREIIPTSQLYPPATNVISTEGKP